MLKRLYLRIWILMLISYASYSQGDGPRAYLLAPKGVTGINAKWINLSQNLIPAGTALIPGAEIKANVFPITAFHTFSLGGRFAQVYGMINPGSATARAKAGPPIGPIPVNELSASGLSDGLIGFKFGLYGAPALNVIEYAKSPMRYSLFVDVRYWYSGSYDQQKLLNMGTNRGTFQIGFPMALPLNDNRAKATWLEISPSMMFFGANNDPARAGTILGVEKITQKPLFLLENHLTHNFNPKFWGGIDLRFQYGGESSADDEPDDNTISVIGGGISAGYQIIPPLSINATYGGVLISNEAKGNMFRLGVTFTYANLKKAQAELQQNKQ
jgi:hypothetical protein